MTAETKDARNEAALEEDVRRTQDEIGDTVEKLEEKLTPREMSRAVIGDDGTKLADDAIEVTRTNPIPVALIAVGVIWLIASSNTPAIKRLRDTISGRRATTGDRDMDLRPRSAEPAPIGPPPETGKAFNRRTAAEAV